MLLVDEPPDFELVGALEVLLFVLLLEVVVVFVDLAEDEMHIAPAEASTVQTRPRAPQSSVLSEPLLQTSATVGVPFGD